MTVKHKDTSKKKDATAKDADSDYDKKAADGGDKSGDDTGDDSKKEKAEDKIFSWSFGAILDEEDQNGDDDKKKVPDKEDDDDSDKGTDAGKKKEIDRIAELERRNQVLEAKQRLSEDLGRLKDKYKKDEKGIFPQVKDKAVKDFMFNDLEKVGSLEAAYILSNFDTIINNAIKKGQEMTKDEYDLKIVDGEKKKKEGSPDQLKELQSRFFKSFGIKKKDE
jgi:hypothetical protein